MPSNRFRSTTFAEAGLALGKGLSGFRTALEAIGERNALQAETLAFGDLASLLQEASLSDNPEEYDSLVFRGYNTLKTPSLVNIWAKMVGVLNRPLTEKEKEKEKELVRLRKEESKTAAIVSDTASRIAALEAEKFATGQTLESRDEKKRKELKDIEIQNLKFKKAEKEAELASLKIKDFTDPVKVQQREDERKRQIAESDQKIADANAEKEVFAERQELGISTSRLSTLRSNASRADKRISTLESRIERMLTSDDRGFAEKILRKDLAKGKQKSLDTLEDELFSLEVESDDILGKIITEERNFFDLTQTIEDIIIGAGSSAEESLETDESLETFDVLADFPELQAVIDSTLNARPKTLTEDLAKEMFNTMRGDPSSLLAEEMRDFGIITMADVLALINERRGAGNIVPPDSSSGLTPAEQKQVDGLF
jgi:hypothetical protein